jgi:probable HAF family extracellular repeat protein
MNAFTVDNSMRRSRREDGAARGWAVERKFLLGLSLAIACQCALAQAMYRIKPLGFLGGCLTYMPYVENARDFNNADEVSGQACNANGDLHAFLWKNNGTPMADLGPPVLRSTSSGMGINASGLVAGFGNDGPVGFAFTASGNGTTNRIVNTWSGGGIAANAINNLGQLTGYAITAGGAEHAFLWKPDGSPMVDLGTLGGDYSVGDEINGSGQIVGESAPPGNGPAHGFVWNNNGTPMVDLGMLGGIQGGSSVLINASGQVAWVRGYQLRRNLRSHVFFWRNDGSAMQDLGTLGGGQSYLTALNDAGQVVGISSTSGWANLRGFIWMNDGTPMKDLGALWPSGINSAGQVVGKSGGLASLFRNDGTPIQDLNKLIDPTDPLRPYITLTNAQFINDNGDILANGTDSRSGLTDLPYVLQGTVLTLTPRTLAFGNQAINTSSATKSVTVTNTGAKIVAVTSVTLAGTAADQFASTNNCGKSLAGHASCTIKVTFKPTSKGAKAATLSVNGGGGGLRVVTLAGTGV